MNTAKTFCRRAMFGLVPLVLLVFQVRAENSLEKTLKTFGSKTVEGYIQPLQDLFAANMSSGWYRSANVPKSGFHISFNIIGMGALLSDDQKVYDAPTPAGFTQKTFQTATVFGKKENTIVTDQATGLSYAGSGGIADVPIFPLAALQATIGHVQGTELIVRGVPLPEFSGFPKITFWGIGARHSISQYFGDYDEDNEPPVHVAFGAFYNKVSVGDFVTVNSFIFGPQVSKSFSILELYGGFAFTKNSMELTYQATSTEKVAITLDGNDKVRGTLGAVLNLGILHLQADANFGKVTSISTSLGFGF
jgi:hypothetical protein